MQWCDRALSIFLSTSLTLSVMGLEGCSKKTEPAQQASTAQPQGQQQDQHAPATQYAVPTADQLYQLVAPIALFPDNLVAQVLAASTFPNEVSEAYQWMQQNSSLKGQQLLDAVNQQSWDASVKGLTQFNDVLSQMATNLSWTSALGDAYFNVPQSVMNAVQVMRQRAYAAGNLKSNTQQNVTVQNEAPGTAAPAPASSGEPQTTVVQPPPQTIIIQPSQPEVVYVPTYNPTVVYGAPVAVYPGYSTGAVVATSLISFGVGIAVGAAISGGGGCCGWGWNSWGCGWHNSSVTYNRNVYVSNSNTFVNRNNYYNRNVNNLNRANVNNANINRNNINNANINRANVNNRANNFNPNARNSNFTEPKFNQKYDQQQFRNQGAQQQMNRAEAGNQGKFNQQGGANQGKFNQQGGAGNRPQQGNAGNHQAQNRAGGVNQPNRDQARGYGQQPDRGTSSGAFNGYSPGGNTRTNSARGQQSLEGRNPGGGGGQRQAAARPQPTRQPAGGHEGGGRRR
jgi:Protein of unknown function (DUF3300)